MFVKGFDSFTNNFHSFYLYRMVLSNPNYTKIFSQVLLFQLISLTSILTVPLSGYCKTTISPMSRAIVLDKLRIPPLYTWVISNNYVYEN